MKIKSLRIKRVLGAALLVLLMVVGMTKTMAQQPNQTKLTEYNYRTFGTIEERVFLLYSIQESDFFSYALSNEEGKIDIFVSDDYTCQESNANSDFDFFLENLYNEWTAYSNLDKTERGSLFVEWRYQLEDEVFLAINEDFNRQLRDGNATCGGALPFCTDIGLYQYPAGVNSGSGESGPYYGCLSTRPNPAWYYMQIDQPGDLNIMMYTTPSRDIDFACWGPFNDMENACSQLTSSNFVDCSYSVNSTEYCHINNAQSGHYYILLITNYSNQPANISFENIGTGSTVNFQGVSSTITATTNPLEGGTVSGSGEYEFGSTCTLTATANEGYTFMYWTENGAVVSYDAEYSFAVTFSRNFVANFALPFSVIVSANPEEGGSVSGGGMFDYGADCTVTATANEGYSFMYWTKNGQQVSSEPTYTFAVTGDVNVVANFTLPFTVTTSVGPGGGGFVSEGGMYGYGANCTVTATPNEGYCFYYWSENGSVVSSDASYTFVVTGDRNLVANFGAPIYITATSNSEEFGAVVGGGNYGYSQTCTLMATANEGYMFDHWSKNGEMVSYLSTYSFTVTESVTIVAVFVSLYGTLVGEAEATTVYLPSHSSWKYALSQQIYTPDEIGTAGDINTISYFNAGGTKTRHYDIYMLHTDKSVFNSKLDWITVSEVERVFSGSVTMTSGYWNAIVLDAPFSYNGTSNLAIIIDDNSGNYTGMPYMECRVFNTNDNQTLHIFSDNTNYDPYNPSGYTGTLMNVKNQIILNRQCGITVASNNTAMGSVSGSGLYMSGFTCTVTATANEGYTFVNWTDASGEVVSMDADYSFIVMEDRTLTANFAEVSSVCNITFDLNDTRGDGWTNNYLVLNYQNGSFQKLTVLDGLSTSYVLPIIDGSHVTMGWISGSHPEDCSFMVSYTNGNVIYYGFNLNSNFSDGFDVDCVGMPLLTFDITTIAEPEVGGTIDGAGEYGYADTCTLIATANEGYCFYNWTENGTVISLDATYSFIVTGNRNLVATFGEPIIITATADPEEGGTVSGGGSFGYNHTCTLTATPNEGYTFMYWTENGGWVSSNATYSFTVRNDRNLVANFALPFSITTSANPPEGGSVTGMGEYDYGSTCTLTATANEGYTFMYWTEDEQQVSSNATYSFTVNSARNLVANFSLPLTITTLADPAEGGSVMGMGEYDYGSTCTVTATANEGYTFVYWMENGDCVSYASEYTFTVYADHNLVAVFRPNYTINIAALPNEGGTVAYCHGSNGSFDFESGMQGWTIIDADGDGYCWKLASEEMGTGYGHNGSNDMVCSASYMNYVGSLNPDNYLVSPQIVLGGSITFYACANDVYYSAEHFGVAVSLTSNTNAADFMTIQEWTMTAKGDRNMDRPRGDRSQGNWYQFTVDLSAYSGLGFVAIRHFNCSDWWYLDVDDIVITPMEFNTNEGVYYQGQTCVVTASPNGGYRFIDWTEDGEIVSTDAAYSFVVESDRNLVANFEELTNHWTVEGYYQNNMFMVGVVMIDGVEQVSPGLELGAFCNDECRGSVFPVENEGRWLYFMTIGGNGGEEITFRLYDHILQQEKDLRCFSVIPFEAYGLIGMDDPYEVLFATMFTISASVNPEDAGIITGAGEYALGTNAMLTATANENYTFMYWTENGQQVSTDTDYTFTVTTDRDLVAHFSLPLSITAVANTTEGGIITGMGEYDYGDTCTLTAMAYEGYNFIKWTKNGNVVSYISPYSFTVTDNADYVAYFDELSGSMVGNPEATNQFLPNYCYYKYSLSQQIYTPEEIGDVSTITSISFFNTGGTKTRVYDIYLVHTDKSTFENNWDWIAVEETDRVFRGSMTMISGCWNTFVFDTPFTYNGTSNLAIVVDNNSGEWSGGAMSCRVYSTNNNQAIQNYSDYTNYDPFNPSGYYGTLMNVKNQIILNWPSCSVSVTSNIAEAGSAIGSGVYAIGSTCTLTATANEGYMFQCWRKNGDVISVNPSYSFTVTENAVIEAVFIRLNGVTIGGGYGTSNYLPSYYLYNYSLTQQIYTQEEIGEAGYITSLSFFNAGIEKTRNFDIYMVHTDKTTFDNNTDWITVSESDCVYSGDVIMRSGSWTPIVLDVPFAYDGNSNLAIIVDDNSGNWSGGAISCRVFNADGNQAIRIYSDGINYNPYNPSGYNGTLMDVKNQIILGFSDVQFISLTTGWNWWSTYIELNGIDGLSMLEDGLGENGIVIKSQNTFVQNNGTQWAGTLMKLYNEQGYKMNVSEDCNSYLAGAIAQPESHPVTLHNNWNWIGYPVNVQQVAGSALANFQPSDNDVIKGQSSFAMYKTNRWLPTNFVLRPGESYMYYSTASEDKTFVFAQGRGEVLPANSEECNWQADRHAYPDNLSLIATVEIEGVEQRDEQLELGAFVNGECRGSAHLYYVEPINRYVAFLTVTGQDVEQIKFRLMDESKATGTSNDHINFRSNAIIGNFDDPLPIHFGAMNGVAGMQKNVSIYPNPIDRNTPFTLDIPEWEDVADILITNALGETARHESGSLSASNVAGLPNTGVYLLKVVCRSGNVYFGRLIVK